jgi:hypothetical protein
VDTGRSTDPMCPPAMAAPTARATTVLAIDWDCVTRYGDPPGAYHSDWITPQCTTISA